MITKEDINQHKEKYPTFDAERLIEWLDSTRGRWKRFDTVSEANDTRRRYDSVDRLCKARD